MRINQYVARASGLSRRAADTAIASGRVKINGKAAILGETAPLESDIRLDDKRLELPKEFTYIALNKPVGYVSSRRQQGTEPTVYDLLPANFRALRIAGRLDRDSSGLLVLTDDGGFLYQLTHPTLGKTKTYELSLSHPLEPVHRARLESGVELTDGKSVMSVRHAAGTQITVELGEGRNRQIRRTFGALGYRVDRLHRTRIGPFQLGTLAPGRWEQITVGAAV